LRGGLYEKFDLIVTDPPYGDNISYGRCGKTILNNEDESINYKILPLLYNVLKPDKSCYIFTNWKFEHKLRHFIENETKFNIRMLICIVKNNFGLGYGFRNQSEYCLVLEKGSPKYNLNDFSNVLKMQHVQHDSETHPHQKGLYLIEKIIQHSSKPGELILDCFSGSGTTAIACHNQKRNFVCIEKDKKYFSASVERLDIVRSQMRLF
jgi:site-specific DNA-methyltransferase (adenine-specific)